MVGIFCHSHTTDGILAQNSLVSAQWKVSGTWPLVLRQAPVLAVGSF